MLPCPPPGAPCPHTPTLHQAEARPAWASPGTSYAPKHASPRRFVCTKPSTREACAGAWSPAMSGARATGNPPAPGRHSTLWPLNPAHAPRLTPARHPRKAPNSARFTSARGQHAAWSYDHAGINTSPRPAAKPWTYPISNGPRAHWPQERMRALCWAALVDAITGSDTARRSVPRCFERGRVCGRPRMALPSPSFLPPPRCPSRHPFCSCFQPSARPRRRRGDAPCCIVACHPSNGRVKTGKTMA